MGLEVETVEPGDQHKPVADYVLRTRIRTARLGGMAADAPHRAERDDDAGIHRMARRQDGGARRRQAGAAATRDRAGAEGRLEARLRADITARILREADLDGQVVAALRAIKRPSGAVLTSGMRRLFERTPESEWRAHVEAVAARLARRQPR